MSSLADTEEIVRISQLYVVAMFGILLWDTLVCWRKEYRYVWRTSWSQATFLYLVSRYWTIITLTLVVVAGNTRMSHASCSIMVHFLAGFGGITSLAASAILAIRTCAVWSNPRWLLLLVAILLSAELAVITASSVNVIPVFPPGMVTYCIPTSTQISNEMTINFAYFLLPCIADALLTALCVYRATQSLYWNYAGAMTRMLIRDGLAYFFACSLVWILAAAFCIQPIPSLKSINAPAAIAISSIMSCRLVLSLRKVADRSMVCTGICRIVEDQDIAGVQPSGATLSVTRPTTGPTCRAPSTHDLEAQSTKDSSALSTKSKPMEVQDSAD